MYLFIPWQLMVIFKKVSLFSRDFILWISHNQALVMLSIKCFSTGFIETSL